MVDSNRVETTTFPRTDIIQPAHHSEKDKRRKFAKTLEEELNKKRKSRKEDELVIEHDPQDQPQEQPEQDAQSEESAGSNEDEASGDSGKNPTGEDQDNSSGIDIEA